MMSTSVLPNEEILQENVCFRVSSCTVGCLFLLCCLKAQSKEIRNWQEIITSCFCSFFFFFFLPSLLSSWYSNHAGLPFTTHAQVWRTPKSLACTFLHLGGSKNLSSETTWTIRLFWSSMVAGFSGVWIWIWAL